MFYHCVIKTAFCLRLNFTYSKSQYAPIILRHEYLKMKNDSRKLLDPDSF